MAAWVIPPDSASADLHVGGVVLFRWRDKGGVRGGFHHLGTDYMTNRGINADLHVNNPTRTN